MTDIKILKRDGSLELLNLEKIHRVVSWACEGITGVSVSEIELRSELQFFDKMQSKDIQQTLIKTSADLINEKFPNYQWVASRLVNFDLRKEVYGQFDPWNLFKLVERNVSLGHYTKNLLEWYDRPEWNVMNKWIKHDRDFNICYAGMSQWLGKYLVQNRVTKEYYETPQVAYMLISATLFHNYPTETRMKYVKDYYDALSKFEISIPTPILAGIRTPQSQASSCTLIDCGDSLDSITSTSTAIVKYVANKAGIGINVGRIRPIGSEIRNGEIRHTGLIPFIKLFYASLSSCYQGGVRKASATVNFPIFHYEIENLLVLKNNKGTEETRVRHMDYCVQFNRLFFERVLKNEDLTLFSPKEVPDLMDAFYSGDNDEFEKLYQKYERARSIKTKKKVSAMTLLQTFLDERINTGRIYAQFIDHCNNHGSFDQKKHKITMTNLCTEITLPTVPFESVTDESGRIALCTLSAINWGLIKKPEDFEKPCDLAVRALDELLSYQDFPMIQAKKSTEEFRTLGIGIINFAYFLAKNNLKYDKNALPKVDEYMEAMSYYLIKTSNKLAKEKGACKLSSETKYGQGIVPYMTASKNLEELNPLHLRMPWEELIIDLKTYGIRNATLMALMPSETSSQLSNSTNGIEPPRGFVSEKASKDGVLKMVVPEFYKLQNKYDLLWDQTSPVGYLQIAAILQRWIDQAISANTSYNPENYSGNKVSLKDLISHFFLAYKYGLKTLYYNNTYDGATDEAKSFNDNVSNTDEDIQGDEEHCSSCVL